MPRRTGRSRLSLDVYLMPSVLGSGRGDIEEVLRAGEVLRTAGARVRLVVQDRSRKPWLDDASFGWARLPVIRRVTPVAGRAMTVSSQFGVTASEPRDEPLGGPGPWTGERRAVEHAYGADHTLHVSLEEFARTLTSPQQADERHREGGRSARERQRQRAERRGEGTEMHSLYRKFRDLGRPNLLTLFPTFSPSAAFAREFPETVQCGPLWPTDRVPGRRARDGGGHSVLWYASPSTSERLAEGIVRGIGAANRLGSLRIRSPRPFDVPSLPGVRVRFVPPGPRRAWAREWASAHLRIATGSRSLLEAIALREPFLYFNGVLGRGRSARRHRPEKLQSLLTVWRRRNVDRRITMDLVDFARGRRVADVVDRALRSPRWRRGFPRQVPVQGFPPAYDSASVVLESVARRYADGPLNASAMAWVIRHESRARAAPGRSAGSSKV